MSKFSGSHCARAAGIRDSGAAVVYNPVASQWKGNAILDAGLLQLLGVPVGLGTDGTRADGFRMMDAAEATQRLGRGLAHRGAEAAGLGALAGRIAPGLGADILLLDLEVPELVPSWDLTWELVRLATATRSRPCMSAACSGCAEAGRSTGMRGRRCAKWLMSPAATWRGPRFSACIPWPIAIGRGELGAEVDRRPVPALELAFLRLTR